MADINPLKFIFDTQGEVESIAEAQVADDDVVAVAFGGTGEKTLEATRLAMGVALQTYVDSHINDAGLHPTTPQALGAIPAAEKGVANGVAPTGADNKIPITYLPARAIPDVSVVFTLAERNALVVQEGDEAIVIDNSVTPAAKSRYIYASDNAWHEIPSSDETVYGSFQRNEVVDPIQTTSNGPDNPATRITLSDVVPQGDYKVELNYGWNCNATTRDFVCWLELDGVQLGQRHLQEPKDAAGSGLGSSGTDQAHYTLRKWFVGLQGAHTFEVKFACSQSGTTVAMFDTSIELIRTG